MPRSDVYGQSIDLPNLLDVPDVEALSTAIEQSISRGVLRFASASARAAAVPSPVDGMYSTLADNKRLYRYNGTQWVVVVPEFRFGAFTVSGSGLDQYTANVTFSSAMSSTPYVFVNLATSSGASSRWIPRVPSASPTGFSVLVQSSVDGATANWSAVPLWYFAIAT
ncbi:hypothetical protein AB0B42_00745 [Streptomyces fradiae]|uniref:hypothetical protein n=1 Tax=Streptomyces fradiae TaxID=1906 RepID=UPI00340CBE8F